MTNVYVGFHDRKNCSRILKPPGGGTSDIFNTSLEEKTPTKISSKTKISVNKEQNLSENITKTETNGAQHNEDNQFNESKQNETSGEGKSEVQPEEVNIGSLTIRESLNEETKEKEETKDENEVTTTTTEVKVSKSAAETLGSIVHQSEHSEVKTTITEKRTSHRVPPGGYSSGLW